MPAGLSNLVADIKNFERTYRLVARLVTGFRHLPYEERLHRRRLWANLTTAVKICTGLLDTGPTVSFSPLNSMRPLRALLRGTPMLEPLLVEMVSHFGEGCEIL